MSSLYSVERGGSRNPPKSWAVTWTDWVKDNQSILFVILFVIAGIFLLALVTLTYFLFTDQNEEVRTVLSPFMILLGFIVWRITTRLGEK